MLNVDPPHTPVMRLQVGELARQAGVTVRTLHHYDSIGLLRPSGRSEGGYRLYDRDDVARLHAIQALRRMGLPLAEVARLLDGGPAALPALLARQIRSLDEDIARAQALRERLAVMQLVLASGGQPELGDWLSSLSLMSHVEQHFSVAELQKAFGRWKTCAAAFPPLVRAIHAAMARGVRTDAPEFQALALQWADLTLRWMEGDVGFLERWGRMLRERAAAPPPDSPGAQARRGGAERSAPRRGTARSAQADGSRVTVALLDAVDEALQLRLAVLSRHADAALRQRLMSTRAEWSALMTRAQRLMADAVPPEALRARTLAADWAALSTRTFGTDATTRDRVFRAYETEPLLQIGLPPLAPIRRYVEAASRQAGRARGDPS